MRQRQWLELVKDYDCSINYHPGKADLVIHALSRNSSKALASLRCIPTPPKYYMEWFGLEIVSRKDAGYLATMRVQPIFLGRVKEAQNGDLVIKS